MNESSRAVRITSLIVIGIGVILLALTIASGGQFNVALPLVFLVLGGGFFILVFRLRQQWSWAVFLYIPGALLIAFGFIFLLNVLTQDRNSWAYAWLLLISAAGVGLLLANYKPMTQPVYNLVGWILAVLGTTLFALFGAIAGGAFIQIAAPILLVAAGLSLRWLKPEKIFPESILHTLHISPEGKGFKNSSQPGDSLVEKLSSRELEVLRLIDSGLSNQEIAEKISIAPSTVKTHINNIYGKLGVQTRVQALNRARELGIFDT